MMAKEKKSMYESSYKIGVSIFVVLVILVSSVVITIVKSCKPPQLFGKKDVYHTDTIIQQDTVFLPNPNPVRQIVHDTVYKQIPCTKKHVEPIKSTKKDTIK